MIIWPPFLVIGKTQTLNNRLQQRPLISKLEIGIILHASFSKCQNADLA